MRISQDAIAGTLESSDCLVKIAPASQRNVTITSSVWAQFGEQITAVVNDTLDTLGVTEGDIEIHDKGALDCTIRARVQGACFRASGEAVDWSVL
ncbi:MAG: citrate lyase acyl carrier protein [Propionibacteriaceae bacterium]